MAQCAAAVLGHKLAEHVLEGGSPRQLNVPTGAYRTRDGWIMVALVTEAHFAAFQTVSADNHPIHYDVEYCRERGHPGLLAHGFQVLCFTAAGASNFALAQSAMR